MARLSDLLAPITSDTTAVKNTFTQTTEYENSKQKLKQQSKFFNEDYDYNTGIGSNPFAGGQQFGNTPFGQDLIADKEPGGFKGFVYGVGDFTGNLIGGLANSALLGIPGLIDDIMMATGVYETSWIREITSFGAYDPWDEEGAAGKWGRGLGEGIGMIIPFKWLTFAGSKAITYGAQKTTGYLSHLAKAGQKNFTTKYLSQQGSDNLISAINRVGGARTGQVMDEAAETFTQGYNRLFEDAFNLVNSAPYKKILKGSQKALSEGVEEMTGSILGTVPKMSRKDAKSLAEILVNEASHQTANSFNTFFEWMVTKTPGLKGISQNTYAKQAIGAYASDFAVGMTMFTAEAVLHNSAVGIASMLSDQSYNDIARNIDPRSKAAQTVPTDGNFGRVIADVAMSSAFMGLIGPARFIKGGTTYNDQGLYKSLKQGLGAITKAWKPVGRMTGDQARTTLSMIDEAADGLLRNKIPSLGVKEIMSLSDDAAKQILKETRRSFTKEYPKWIMKEFLSDMNIVSDIAGVATGKGFQSSVPRMIAGAVAMNAPGLYSQMINNPKEFYKAFGQDGHEIAQNIIMGMAFSRSGRSFNAGGQGKYFEAGDLRQYYGNNINDINKMRFGLEVMGMSTKDMALASPNALYSATSQHVKNQPFFKDIDDLVYNDFYVDRVDPNAPTDRKAAGAAYFDYIQNDLGISPGTPEFKIAVEKYNRFKKVMEAYDNTAPDINKMFRTVNGKEIVDLIENINSLPEIANSKNLDLTISNSITQAYINANKPYTAIRKEFVLNTLREAGIEVEARNDGVIVIPEIDLESFGSSNRQSNYVRNTELINAKYNLKTVIDQGVKDGWINVQGTRNLVSNPENLKGFVDSFSRSKEAMLVHIYGSDSVKSGAFPIGGKDASELVLINQGMRAASLDIKQMEQTRNAVSLLTRGNYTKQELYNTLPEGKRERIVDLMQQIGMDKNPQLDLSNVDPKDIPGVTDFFARLTTLNKLLNPKGSNEKVSVTATQIAGLQDAIFDVVGDALTNKESYNAIQNEAYNHFINLLKINNASSPHSVGMAVHHLLNGTRVLNGDASFNNNLGKFAIRTQDGIILPDSDMLLAKIKSLSPDKAGIIDNEGLLNFYKELQANIENAGTLIQFTKQTKDLDLIIAGMGPDAIVDLITQAKSLSDQGAMSDLIHKTSPLEGMQSKIRENMNDLVRMKAIAQGDESKIFENMQELYGRTRNLVKLLQFAMQNHDYAMLGNLTKNKMEFDKFFNELNEFNNMNPMKDGNIDAEWTQMLTSRIAEAKNFLNKNYGTIDLQNYSNYVRDQLKSQKFDLPDYKHDEMIVSITPTQFESRYGLSATSLKTIIEPHRNQYLVNKNTDFIKTAFNDVKDKAMKNQAKYPTDKQKNEADLDIDVLQTVLTAFNTKEVPKVKFVATGPGQGKFVLSKDYLVNQSKTGVLAVMDILNMKDTFYMLDQSMQLPDPNNANQLRNTSTLSEGELAVFKASIDQPTYIDNPQARIDVKKGTVGNSIDMNIKPENYVYIPLDESAQIVVPKKAAQESILEAYGPNGAMRERLTYILKDADPNRLQDILSKFSDVDKLTTSADIESAILTARLAVDAPHVLVDNIKDVPTLADVWKRLKLPEFTKGKIYTDEVLQFMSDFYKDNVGRHSYFKDVNAAFDSFKDSQGRWRNMKFMSLADESGDSYFNSQTRLEAWMDSQENIYGKDVLWSDTERAEIIAQHENSAKSIVDAPTYLSKEAFIIHLAQLGMRKEWLITDNQGNITGFKSGAMKPKGAHTEVNSDGSIVVYYDKTAFFYDSKMDRLMKSKGIDGISFESGNKINKYRETSQSSVIDRYINSDKGSDSFSNTVFEDIGKVIRRTPDGDYIDLPLSTFNVTNISREHNAKAGANLAVHMTDNKAVYNWMGLDSKINTFQEMLTRANSNEFALTSMARELMGYKEGDGDLLLNKVPVEEILNQEGLIMDQWMGDMVADKLFSFFFEGGKIATNEVGNSSITPMAAPIHMDLSTKDLAIRRYENIIDGTGKSVKVGRQILIGDYTPDSFHMDKQFSFNGRTNSNLKNGDSNVANEGSFFVRRLKVNIGGVDKTGDFSIIPVKAKKGGKQEWAIVGMGYEIFADRVVDINVKDSNGNTGLVIKADNKAIYNNVISEIGTVYKDLMAKADKAPNNDGVSNRYVASYLNKNAKDFKLGILNNRQPRNLVNDVVINKITAEPETRMEYGVKVTRNKFSTEAEGGNKSEQNFVDAIETQDSDYDYDKSSAYLSAPGSFIKDIAGKAGYGNRNDSYSFAEKFFAELNLRLDSGSEMAEHLRIVKNSSAVRGRIVKLHNIVTYFKNAFGEDPVLGRYDYNNQGYEIRLKGNAEMLMVADNIANWAKIFIDNYKNPTDTYNIQPLVETILFGDAQRRHEGLFEIVNTRTNEITPYVDGAFKDIRRVINQKMVKPISKYLRYNRGMTETQAGDSQSLKLKDLANGFESLQKDLDNPYLYDNNWQFSIGNKSDYALNIRNGMQTLSDYILGGWASDANINSSQNPYDIAMRNLNAFYRQTIAGKNTILKTSEVQDIMNKAEAGMLLESEGVQAFDRQSITKALWEHVKNDYNFIEMTNLTYRVQSLQKQHDYLKRDKYADPQEVKDLETKIAQLNAVKSDLELKLGAQAEYENGKSTFKLGRREAKTFQATQDIVFWDKDGNIAMTLEKGAYNPRDIESSWVAITNPRRFALVHPDQQKKMYAKMQAFSSLPMETNPNTKDVTYMNETEYQRVIVPTIAKMQAEMKIEKQRFAKGQIDGNELAVNRKAILNKYLNDEAIVTPLQRKALLWDLLRPKTDKNKVSFFKDNDGNNINSLYLYENPMNKTAWQFLMDVISQESFTLNNNMTKLEAKNLATEIIGRQTLALLGVKNHHLEVKLDYSFGDFNANKNRNLYIELNNKELQKMPGFDADSQRALEILNDFIHKETLLSPAQVYRLQQKVDMNSPDIFDSNSNAADRIPARSKRVFGTTEDVTPISFIDQLTQQNKNKRKINCAN
ncbi:MAG: hypothetical protein Unbinned4409contig1002_24 [Prokaryotic dsDNA virus sp.]|nr:MAG: hypothetical protein Unbinned4409contig1002_24 [Prokaryotic dsDNA virus sp.]|tara:strand:- start:15393 stop:24455 length:9063 start_codon:yes stop_codon:yes gene_type:complete